MRARTLVGAVAGVGVAAAGVAAGWAVVLRPRARWWGTAPEDRQRVFPGDDLVHDPQYEETHAVTIEAPAEAVWPWLAQLGQGRGGLYSYDWLENLVGCDLHSADEVVPAWQHLAVGDEVRLYPRDERSDFDLCYQVAAVEPWQWLVLVTPGDPVANAAKGLAFGTWAFVVERLGPERSRLVVRSRGVHPRTVVSELANHWLLEPVHAVMERKMLLGIKARAERLRLEAVAADPR